MSTNNISSTKLNISIFLEFVEIKTKLASLFPMLTGFLWSIYHYHRFTILNGLIFFLAAILFDMATTSINNLLDFRQAVNQDYKQHENVIGKHQLDQQVMIRILFTLLGLAIMFSIILVFLTDPLILIIGGIFYLIGIFYTFGPLPISRTPFGELLSGLTMGFGIFYLAVFIHQPQDLLSSHWSLKGLIIYFNWLDTMLIFWMSLPFVSLIANIMLANNSCDLETDRLNERFTLVHYIGKKRAVILYQILSVIPWLVWLTYILFGLIPWWACLMFLGMIPHYQSVRKFSSQQIKSKTFIESLKSFTLFSLIYVATLVLSLF